MKNENPLDIDLSQIEGNAQKDIDRYSASVIMGKLLPVLAWDGVKDKVYGKLYEYRMHGYISFMSGDEDVTLLKIIEELSLEDRKSIASIIGSLRFSVDTARSVATKNGSHPDTLDMRIDDGEKLQKIIFSKISQGRPL